MKDMVFLPFLLLLTTGIIHDVLSTDDRFIKRYAIMKMYESCFGPEVVKEVRKEMKMATAKCSSVASSSAYSLNGGTGSVKTPVSFTIQSTNKHQSDNLYSSDHLKSQPSSNIDLNKLQQAIFTGFNKHLSQPSYTNTIGLNGNNVLGYSHLRPWTYQVQPNVLPYSHVNAVPAPQPSAPTFMSPSLTYPTSPFYHSLLFSPFYGVGRSSKDLDVKGQLESLAVRVSGRIKNVTCIMQELGYLDENLEPHYEEIINRIKKLSVANELKSDMIDGVRYCKQFSSCVPDDSKDKLSKEMVRPMFFFRCYKHKKMEACIMKDIKDRYASDESDYNIIGVGRNDRSQELNNSDAAEFSLHEFLFGNGDIDLETL